jgi:hypothetical protein
MTSTTASNLALMDLALLPGKRRTGANRVILTPGVMLVMAGTYRQDSTRGCPALSVPSLQRTHPFISL